MPSLLKTAVLSFLLCLAAAANTATEMLEEGTGNWILGSCTQPWARKKEDDGVPSSACEAYILSSLLSVTVTPDACGQADVSSSQKLLRPPQCDTLS